MSQMEASHLSQAQIDSLQKNIKQFCEYYQKHLQDVKNTNSEPIVEIAIENTRPIAWIRLSKAEFQVDRVVDLTAQITFDGLERQIRNVVYDGMFQLGLSIYLSDTDKKTFLKITMEHFKAAKVIR